MTKMKTCKECSKTIPYDDFPKFTHKSNGKRYALARCKDCNNARRGKPADKRANHLKNRYGITPEQYDEMLEAQGGVCAICKQAPEGRRLAVDHCHTTGNNRGLLCINCNTALGKFFDNTEYLSNAIRYLNETGI